MGKVLRVNPVGFPGYDYQGNQEQLHDELVRLGWRRIEATRSDVIAGRYIYKGVA